MQDITLGPFNDNGFIFDLGELGRYLEGLTDTRGAQGKVYPLARILAWMLLARLCADQDHFAGVVVMGYVTGIDGWGGRSITGRTQAEEGDDDQPTARLRMMAQEKCDQQGSQANGQPGPQRTGRQHTGR